MRKAALAAILAAASGMAAGADDWPGYRGPTGMGTTPEKDLPVEWGGPEGKNVLWKAPLKGEGHASPVVSGDRVFVCTAFWPDPAVKRETVIPEHHVLCYAAADGRLLWDVTVPPGPWLRNDFRSGPGGGYACPTPATDGKFVYCAFGSSVIAALDFSGKIVWRKDIIPFTFDVTVGGSPVLFEDSVLFLCAMAKPADSKVVAFDKATGEVRWQKGFPKMAFGHSTPVLLPVGGKTQVVFAASGGGPSAEAVQALDAKTGERLWWCWGAGDTASPVFGGGVVYVDSSRGGPGVAVDPTGSGDVTATHTRWKVDRVPEGIGSAVVVGDHVYRLHTPSVVKCWELKTGRQVYAERLDKITTTWASPVADGNGRLYFASAGRSFVVQSGPEFKILAVNDLGDPNHASPAVAGGSLFLAGTKQVFCVRKKAP